MADSSQRIISEDPPYVGVQVRIRGQEFEGPALLDTGYDGTLIIPDSLVALLGQGDTTSTIIVGDGRPVESPVYFGSLEINGLTPIPLLPITAIGDEFILGRGLMDRYRVCFDHGEQITIEV